MSNTDNKVIFSDPSGNKSRWNAPAAKLYTDEIRKMIQESISTGVLDFATLNPPDGFRTIENRMNLAGIALDKEEFINCEIRNALFDDASFKGALFSKVTFVNCSFSSCDFNKASFIRVTVGPNCIFDGSDFCDAQLSSVTGFSDDCVKIPFKYSEPHYFQIVGAAVTKLFKGSYNAGVHTGFTGVDTKKMTDSSTKELREYINWYQHLMTQIESFRDRSLWNRVSLFWAIILTKYWSSFWALTMWALVSNAFIAFIITNWGETFKFHHPDYLSWNWFDAFYYCIVTFTTLGYGDVTPENLPAQIAAGTVAVAGYFTLGILIYLIARKIDRKY